MSAYEVGKEFVPERIGDWLQTFSGRRFWPLDPRPDEVYLVDIANALARICRFGGHCAVPFYSVAQHSVLVASLVAAEFKRVALLHDAAEAYVGDMIRPLKRSRDFAAVFCAAERNVAEAVGQRFDVDLVDLPREVKAADNLALAIERRDVMAPGLPWGGVPKEHAHRAIEWGWSPEYARDEFLSVAAQLGLEGP